jgi:uncharacterized protein YqeY
MPLKTLITEDMKAAMKSGEKQKLDTIRSIRAAILEFDKSGAGREMNEDDEIKILSQLAKKRRDSIEMYNKAGRKDLAENEETELAVIETYLPKQMTDEEIAELVDLKLKEAGFTSPSDMGKAMGVIVPLTKGKADGRKVQMIVKEKLAP